MISTAIRRDDFEALLISDLETLWEGEKRLKRLYLQLPKKPQLREFFLRELAKVQLRAECIHGVLSSYETSRPAVVAFPSPSRSPAA
jgi:hypothetical protein